MSSAARAPLAALAASIGLIAVYLAFGGATFEPATTADPCQQRDADVLDERNLFETVALAALDGAACDLGVGREELALALADEAATAEFAEAYSIESDDIEAAVRSGLERAVDDAAATGRISGVEESILRTVAENAPIGPAITALQALPGDDSVQGLLQQLGNFQQIPGIEDIPGYDQLNDLLP